MEEQKHEVNTKNVPAIVMLSAGAVASIVMIATGVDTKRFLTTLLVVLIIFYIAGSIIKVILDKSFKVLEAEPVDMEGLEAEAGESAAAPEGADNDSYVVEER